MSQRRVLICGDRNWPRSQRDVIIRELATLPPDAVIIEGENGYHDRRGVLVRGVDKLAAEAARERGLEVLPFPADWSNGAGGGPRRNTQMLVEGKPTEVWAFHPDIANSKGTRNMVSQAEAAGLPVRIFTE